MRSCATLAQGHGRSPDAAYEYVSSPQMYFSLTEYVYLNTFRRQILARSTPVRRFGITRRGVVAETPCAVGDHCAVLTNVGWNSFIMRPDEDEANVVIDHRAHKERKTGRISRNLSASSHLLGTLYVVLPLTGFAPLPGAYVLIST